MKRLPELMNSAQVIAYLRISRSTFNRLRERGVLHGYKVGYTWRYRRDEVARLVEYEAS